MINIIGGYHLIGDNCKIELNGKYISYTVQHLPKTCLPFEQLATLLRERYYKGPKSPVLIRVKLCALYLC